MACIQDRWLIFFNILLTKQVLSILFIWPVGYAKKDINVFFYIKVSWIYSFFCDYWTSDLKLSFKFVCWSSMFFGVFYLWMSSLQFAFFMGSNHTCFIILILIFIYNFIRDIIPRIKYNIFLTYFTFFA